MDIVIPTCGRWTNQPTLEALSKLPLEVCNPTLVVQAHDADEYARRYPCSLTILPRHITTIAPTRQWILENVGSSDKLLMLDDDLSFAVRREDDRTKLLDAGSTDIEEMLKAIAYELTTTAHVGIAAREGANRTTGEFLWNTRIMRVLGYNRADIGKVRFDQMEVMEDFDVALNLLERGYKNLVLNNWTHNQAGSGKAGGCSTFRTPEMQARNAHLLHARHPKYVQVVEKTTKGAWGGGTRTDVKIAWKKAYNDSRT